MSDGCKYSTFLWLVSLPKTTHSGEYFHLFLVPVKRNNIMYIPILLHRYQRHCRPSLNSVPNSSLRPYTRILYIYTYINLARDRVYYTYTVPATVIHEYVAAVDSHSNNSFAALLFVSTATARRRAGGGL